MFFLKKLAVIVFVNIMFTCFCHADIWNYAIDGDFDFEIPGQTNTVHGKLLNLDVSFSGYYKNGDKLDSQCSSRIIKLNVADKYYLDLNFLKYIFGELKSSFDLRLKTSNADELNSEGELLIPDNKDYRSGYTDPFFSTNDQTIYRIHERPHGSPDILIWHTYIWTKSLYFLANITPHKGKFSNALIEFDDILFSVNEDSIRLQEPKSSSDNEEKLIGIYYKHVLCDELTEDRWYHPSWHYSILDENYFIFTKLEFTVNTSNLNYIQEDVALRYENGVIYTRKECLLKVYNTNGVPVAETFGESLDISSFPKGVYIVRALGKTLKVRL